MHSPSQGITRQLLPGLALNLLAGLLMTGSYLLQALLLTWLTEQALTSTMTLQTPILLALVANALIRAALIGWQCWCGEKLASTARIRLRQPLFKTLLAPGSNLLQQHSAAKLQSTLLNGVEVMEGYYSRYLPAWLLAICGSALTVITLAIFDGLSALILLIFMVACPTIDQLFMRRQRAHIVGVFAAMQQFAEDLMDSLRGMLTLKACHAVAAFRGRIARHAASLREESMSSLRVTMMRGGMTRFITLLGIASLLILNSWRAGEGSIEPAVLLLTMFISWQAFSPILQLEGVFHTLWAAQEMRPALQQLSAASATVREADARQPLPEQYDIRFENLTFSWPDAARPLFNNLSLQIAENSHTALIGPSGSGKSTLMQLLMRFIDPQQGTIRLADTPINTLSVAALRSRISWVSQQVFLLDGTLAENLRLTRPTATDDELWQVLQQAQLADWVRLQPQQLATPVGENGKALSGGQRQRLAIARALLKQSPILIFDEVTSNLDVANEHALQQVIAALSGTCTLITIAHRLNTVASANYIVVLQQGEIIEQGRPADLLRRNGYYATHQQAQERAI